MRLEQARRVCRAAVAPAPRALSRRQAQAMDLLVQGKRDSEIARELGISHRTAQHHVDTACAKLGADTRPQAAVLFDRLSRA